MDKIFTIRVCKGTGAPGCDCEYLVVVITEVNGITLGQVRLAGGSRDTAIGIAHSLKGLADNGTDLMEFLPEPEPIPPEKS